MLRAGIILQMCFSLLVFAPFHLVVHPGDLVMLTEVDPHSLTLTIVYYCLLFIV